MWLSTAVIYRPTELWKDSLDQIGKSSESISSNLVVITVDFNAHALEWGVVTLVKVGWHY